MNILSVCVLLFVYLTGRLDSRYHNLIYIKLFLISSIFFYYARCSNMLLSIIFSIISIIYIVLLVYKFININNLSKNDNTIFQVAHEVKNPLAVCKGYLDMLDINNKEKSDKYISVVKKEMNRALGIMDDFLNVKKISLDKDLLDFSLLLADIKETISLVLRDNDVNIVIPSLDEELIIEGDYDKLKQVIINLIKNSYEARAKNIKLIVKVSKDKLKLEVIDDGVGISNSDLDKIGNIFYTTKAMGTGIGVFMSKEILKLHSGSLTYDSKLNTGTIASVLLPLEYVL